MNPVNYRFLIDSSDVLLYKTSRTEQKRVFGFDKCFGLLWKSHLSPSMNCVPKSAKVLAKDFAKTVFFQKARVVATAIKRVCHGCILTLQSKPCLPYVPTPIRVETLMERIQIDLIDLAPDSELKMRLNISSYKYILSITECLSRYCFLFRLRQKSAEEVQHLLQFFFIENGSPLLTQSDNGKEFVNKLITDLLATFETTLVHGKPYHPQSQV